MLPSPRPLRLLSKPRGPPSHPDQATRLSSRCPPENTAWIGLPARHPASIAAGSSSFRAIAAVADLCAPPPNKKKTLVGPNLAIRLVVAPGLVFFRPLFIVPHRQPPTFPPPPSPCEATISASFPWPGLLYHARIVTAGFHRDPTFPPEQPTQPPALQSFASRRQRLTRNCSA